MQVHPDDSYALEHEGEYGKTEMWYILDCEENASLYYGFKKDVTKEEYKNAIENNTLTDILNKIPVHKGDVFFIPAGTVHAIGAGILICEIQQNSNTTYRVYDYNRRDKKEIRARFMLKRQSPYLIYLRLLKFSKSPMKAMQYLLNANILQSAR